MFAALGGGEFALVIGLIAIPVVVFVGIELMLKRRQIQQQRIATRDKSRARNRP